MVTQFGGLKVLVIRKGEKQLFEILNKKYDQVNKTDNGDIQVKIDDVNELWSLLESLTAMKIGKDVEILTPTLEDVFLKITGYSITEEGELR